MLGLKDPKPGLAPGFVFSGLRTGVPAHVNPCTDIHGVAAYTRCVATARQRTMRKTEWGFLFALCACGNAAAAVSCPTAQKPAQSSLVAPVAAELASATAPLGTPGSVLAQAYDDSQSLEQVLLRIRIEACRDVAIATPAPGAVSADDPAAYKPRTQYDNTPWRFNMNQNGRNMTADEFSAWMKSRGVRVARGAAPAAVPAAAPATGTPAAPPAPAAETAPPSD
jgi:hypothetical protein